ncbi:MAG: glycosyltransferase [Deferribacteres bacterium]|nr:glycosyltransferase [candidate division KSB1 bacterium]MCB9502857.1 glycosyltransferase [Deferribacteres bacterium]
MTQFSFIIPYYEENQRINDQIKSILSLNVEFEIIVFDERHNPANAPELIHEEKSRYIKRAHRNRAALFNDGYAEAKGIYLVVLPPDIELIAENWNTVKDVLTNENAAILYSDYVNIDGDKNEKGVKLWPFKNNIDERFSLGYFRIYRISTLKSYNGFDEHLFHAEEYDFRLRVQDKVKVLHLDKSLYKSIIREVTEVDPALSKLHAPGEGAKGGFSYLFYSQEMERELEQVFINFLKRTGCYLSQRNKEIPYTENDNFECMVTIVIPILNRKRFIKNTVNRVLGGTFADFEILIVDNGSNDGTQDEVRSIPDSRVRLIQHDGTCIAEALNRGINEARGKYIAQLDSDDEYVPHTLESMVNYMESHPKCGLAISYYDLIDIDSNPISGMGIIKHLEYNRNNILRVDGAGALRFFHKKVLQEFGLYNVEDFGNFGEDYDMVLKISEKYDVDRVHEILYRYRRHEDNTDVQRPTAMKVYNKNNARQDALKRRFALNQNGSK